MNKLALLLLFVSAPSFACWNMKATLSVNDSEVEINQKINHDQVYSFAKGKYIFNVKMPSDTNLPTNVPVKKGAYLVLVDVIEKEELNLKPIANGMIVANFGKEATMTKNDQEEKVLTTMKIVVTEI